MADEKEGAAEAPKKSNKMMLIIIVAAVVLLGGGGGAFFMMRGDSASAAKTPDKGSITAIENALTINLADSHYLKLQFSLQQTADAGSETLDTSEAIELAIDEYTGRTVAELSTEKGRAAIKEDLVAKVVKAYTENKKEMVMDIYYTAFVTQ
ncbi:flagellar basal body-associated FliL family protein [Actinoplanes subtropicus]|uniref:flagellar basal body-associated FliL family protein n=1 Tax=Actinoplanes subtropicus TaxID=543632 RepID=UPI0004C3F151|nr:flagellar basal body-associated FliL family protein [Actinoplanes subtropicus]